MLKLHNFTVTYPDGYVAVNNVNLEVARGETVALLGSSGSGKSSLLRGIAGLEATSGSVIIDDEDISRLPTYRRGVGMVFQDGQLFPNRSVGKNIAYGVERSMPADKVAKEVAYWLRVIGLEGFENRDISTLSGGQAQRVALARSLAPRPRVLLLDEPLSALDTQLRSQLSEFLRDTLTQENVTAIYVTHNPEEATTVAARTIRMNAGVLVCGASAVQAKKCTDARPFCVDLRCAVVENTS
ncbi:ATP-binding cassette domain-containing protein [Actinotignum urinale]|uniref:ABC transporter ATP-binding protein n=1 Tax=Actinotignum urinale TaxID=190146 RepID=UPI002A7F2989|nr:ATP-binding cassette domain-containing protein [Actinotignum urinale]MDY5128550.1 ATP-binding cassette domain-containing protein [Actinotignum urinale]